MLIHRGSRAVKSVPAEMLLAAMLVPSWARAKDAAMMKTPKRVAPVTLGSSRNMVRRVRGDQMGSSRLKMTWSFVLLVCFDFSFLKKNKAKQKKKIGHWLA